MQADSWSNGEPQYGLYKIPTSPSLTFDKFVDDVKAQIGGATDGRYYYATWRVSVMGIPYHFVDKYDLKTGEAVFQYTPPYLEAEAADITYDATDGKFYAINKNATGYVWTFSTIEYGEDEVTFHKIKDLEGDWNAIAADASGNIYGIRKELYDLGGMMMEIGSTLVKFDKATGDYTEIGETGYCPHFTSSAAIDPETNRMFWTVSAMDGLASLCEVNLATGEATEIYTFPDGEVITGLYINVPEAAGRAPAEPKNIALSFPEGAMSGSVTFDIPDKYYNGETASGPVRYTILANEEKAAEGDGTFGQRGCSATVSIARPGNTVFEVFLTNESGESPRGRAQCFVGNGIPKAPAGVQASYDGSIMTITWQPVNESADGGYVAASGVTYTVTEMPSGETVVENTTSLTASKAVTPPENLTPYYFLVKATYNGLTSAEGRSNNVPLGAITPPYLQGFDSEDAMVYFTYEDANGDGLTWAWQHGEAIMRMNHDMAMDDWMFTPPVKLETGCAYRITADLRSDYIGFTERAEIKAGTSPSSSGMSIPVVNPTEVSDQETVKMEGYLVPTATGQYYIGIHGISDADQARLFIDNFSISEGHASALPAHITDFQAIPDASGEHSVEISAKAPSEDIAGNKLDFITKVVLTRNGEDIKTWTAPATGATLNFTDHLDTFGTNIYSIKAYNDLGTGPEVTAEVFVGMPIPGRPENIRLVETGNPGYLNISWDPITTDHEGNPINPDKVVYSVYGFLNGIPQIIIANGITETEKTFYAGATDIEQIFLQFAVFGTTESGNGVYSGSPMLPYGRPHKGYSNSFANGQTEMLLGHRAVMYGQWMTCNDESFGDISASDGDNGFLLHEGAYEGWAGAVYTGKVSLEGMANPTLSFRVHPLGTNDQNLLEVRVREYGKEWASPLRMPVNTLGLPGQWNQVTVPLTEYKDKIVQVEFIATTKNNWFTALDAIVIGDVPDIDLGVNAISAPGSAYCGKEIEIEATIANHGASTVDSFILDIFANDDKAGSRECQGLAPGQTRMESFTVTMPALAAGPVAYTAKVTASNDGNPSNDLSNPAIVTPIHNNLPPVENLVATKETDTSVTLTWDAPTLNPAEMMAVTETFENGSFGDTFYPGWTFLDEDGIATGGVGSVDFPGVTTGETPLSYLLIDSTWPQLNPSFAPHEGSPGTKYLASFYNVENTAISDWLISPRLNGEAQAISFWVRSYDESMPEQCEVLYSETGTDIADFTPIRMFEKLWGHWVNYSFDIPSGTRHFAVRSCGVGTFMLFIDDITYIPDGAVMPEFTGYNVYRDGVQLNQSPLNTTIFSDNNVTEGRHSYAVTTIFNTGESRPVQADVNQSAIDDAITRAIEIRVSAGAVYIIGGNGDEASVHTVDGRLITSVSTSSGTTRIPLIPGIYIVRAASQIAKVAVR